MLVLLFQALSVLLELSASSNEQPKFSDYSASSKEEAVSLHSSDGVGLFSFLLQSIYYVLSFWLTL